MKTFSKMTVTIIMLTPIIMFFVEKTLFEVFSCCILCVVSPWENIYSSSPDKVFFFIVGLSILRLSGTFSKIEIGAVCFCSLITEIVAPYSLSLSSNRNCVTFIMSPFLKEYDIFFKGFPKELNSVFTEKIALVLNLYFPKIGVITIVLNKIITNIEFFIKYV